MDISDEVKEVYKNHAKFYQDYDIPQQWKNQPISSKERNLDPFKKMNWKNLYDANKKGRLFFKEVNGEIVWSYIISESKTNRGLKDFADDVVGTIKVGDLQVLRFAYKDNYKQDLINDIEDKRKINNFIFDNEKKNLWFTDINMELDKDKSLCNDMNLKWLSSKVTAVGSEVRGIWYNGDTKQKGFSPYEDLKIKKMNFSSITKNECKELVDEIINYQEALNSWSYDGINGNYGGPEKTWSTVEIVPINPNSEIDYKIIDNLPKLKKIIEVITTVKKCTWIVITRVEPKKGIIMRHSDIGHDSWDYQTKNGLKIGQSLRVHFPLQVDNNCVFTQVGIDGIEENYNLKVGEYYYMDKRKPHWVVNNSDNFRFHVIMDLECEQKHLDSLI
jgi:hypothetical protein|tara:strand:- start:42 stop:1205 length:1164 start_codon:yes stop_codon:yes gene_type:complete